MTVRRSIPKVPVETSEEVTEEIVVVPSQLKVQLIASDSFTMLVKRLDNNTYWIVPYNKRMNTYEAVEVDASELADAKQPVSWVESLTQFAMTAEQLQEALYRLGYYQDTRVDTKQLLRDLALRGQFPIITQ